VEIGLKGTGIRGAFSAGYARDDWDYGSSPSSRRHGGRQAQAEDRDAEDANCFSGYASPLARFAAERFVGEPSRLGGIVAGGLETLGDAAVATGCDPPQERSCNPWV
jgi:hypothetical protein